MLLFKTNNLSFAYKEKQVIQNLNFSYDDEDFLVITGENGCGKSTLAKLIIGLLPCKQISYFGLKKSDLAYVPQICKLKDGFYLKTIDLVLMGVKRRFGFYTKADKIRAFLALKRLKILHLWDKKLDALSGGQRQKAFIARAICMRPRLLILDEPTSSTDPKSSSQIMGFLRSLSQSKTGVIVISHDVSLAYKYSKCVMRLTPKGLVKI